MPNYFSTPFRVVKLSSPYLNVLIVVGVILFYVDVILFGVDEGTPASRCTVNALCMVSYCIYILATVQYSVKALETSKHKWTKCLACIVP